MKQHVVKLSRWQLLIIRNPCVKPSVLLLISFVHKSKTCKWNKYFNIKQNREIVIIFCHKQKECVCFGFFLFGVGGLGDELFNERQVLSYA